MRNRRLLTLAVLAVAIGFAAYAQAAIPDPYGTAVLTVVQNQLTGSTGEFTMSVRLWDNTGIGVEVTAGAGTPGLAYFAIKAVAGTGDFTVSDMDVDDAPHGDVTDAGVIVGGGFADNGPLAVGELPTRGIRYAGENAGTPTDTWNAVGFQPIAYDSTTGDPLRNAAILFGVGTTGGNFASTQNGVGTWSNDTGAFLPDTQIAYGTYTNTSAAGGIAAETWGLKSFGTLSNTTPNLVAGEFVGPTTGDDTFAVPIKAVLIQTIQGDTVNVASSNDGGKNAAPLANPVRQQLVAGSIILGAAYAGGANVSLEVSGENTYVTMAGDQTFGGVDAGAAKAGLDVRLGNTGEQVVDIAAARVKLYTGNLAQTVTNINGMLGGPTDGIHSSQVNLANEVLVVSPKDGDHVEIIATIMGDINLDRTVSGSDYDILLLNWESATPDWTKADITGSGGVRDGFVNGSDYDALLLNWEQSFAVTAPAVPAPPVPEPATMSLLCLGALGLLRRRRRS